MPTIVVGVGIDDVLVDPLRDRERRVLFLAEYRLETSALRIAEQFLPGAGGAAKAVERIPRTAAVPTGVLLHALATQIQLRPGQSHDVERIHHRRRIGNPAGRGVLVAAEPVHRHHFDTSRKRRSAGRARW